MRSLGDVEGSRVRRPRVGLGDDQHGGRDGAQPVRNVLRAAGSHHLGGEEDRRLGRGNRVVGNRGSDHRLHRGAAPLIGPNGAGKTTCFNLLTKFLEPTSGAILFNGQDITGERPAQIARRGIIRSFQISAVFPHLTLLENVRLGLQRALGTSYHFWKSERSLKPLDIRARALLAEVGLEDLADELTVNLPYGRKRALEIATTLAMEPELMLLDEPTQGIYFRFFRNVPRLCM